MAFPDRFERTVELAHPLVTVCAALTTAEGLAAPARDRDTPLGALTGHLDRSAHSPNRNRATS